MDLGCFSDWDLWILFCRLCYDAGANIFYWRDDLAVNKNDFAIGISAKI